MAYNNGFPVTYPQYYQQMPAQIPMQNAYQPQNNMPAQNNAPQSSNLVWVQGEAGAKSYLVAPNTTVQLWDSESQTIYLKSADASGMPSMKILDYTIRDSQPTQVQSPVPEQPQVFVDYVTQDEFKAFEKEIKKQISGLKKGGKDDE